MDLAEQIEKAVDKMKALNVAIEKLEGKRDDAGDDADMLEAIDEELQAKNEEFEAAEAELKKLKAKKRRQDLVASLGDVDTSKTGSLSEVEMPKSDHNESNWEAKRNQASMTYLIDGPDAFAALARDQEQLVDSVTAKGENKSGVRAPSYIADHILTNRFVGKGRQIVAKGTDDVVTSDTSGTASGGGSLVPETFIPELYKLPQIETRLMDRCRVKRAVGGEAQFPRLVQSTNRFGVAMSWGTEGSKITEDNPVFNQLTINTGRLTGLSQVSVKELRVNRVGLEAEMATMFRGAFNSEISQAIIAGSGTNNRPQGINTNTSISDGVNVVARTTASQVAYEDLVELQYSIEDGTMSDGIWVVSTGANGSMKYIAALTDSEDRPLLTNMIDWTGSTMVNSLLGHEYIYTPDNTATLGNRGDVIFGAFSNYGVAVDTEINIERSDQFAFDKGLVTYRVIGYVGGKPLGENAFSLLGDVSTASSSSSSST